MQVREGLHEFDECMWMARASLALVVAFLPRIVAILAVVLVPLALVLVVLLPLLGILVKEKERNTPTDDLFDHCLFNYYFILLLLH